nr:MAG TPA: hypothetical protein [Caudoviricetes sp.]
MNNAGMGAAFCVNKFLLTYTKLFCPVFPCLVLAC